MSSEAARYIQHELPRLVQSAISNAENNVISMGTPTSRAQSEENRRRILENMKNAKGEVIKAFDRAEQKMEASMPYLSKEQQEDLVHCSSRLGKFVEGVTKLIEDIVDRVITFFCRALDKIKELLIDFKDTISSCCNAVKRFAMNFFQ